jgi:ketosteroid isomerase-like protein
MSDREAVLFANEAFYLAFQAKDISAMADAWAHEAPVTCIHPGWSMLEGRESVLESWRGIFEGGNSPDIVCRGPQAFIYGDAATVICFEAVGGGFLIATNIFVREGGRWKIIHHQAGTTNGTPPPESESPATSFN